MPDLNSLLKISFDELRVQMLGTQVAFGFQFQSLFQDRLLISAVAIQAAALIGLSFIVLTLGLLIAAPAIHRIADEGQATERTRRLTAALARFALATLAIALASTVFMTVATEFDQEWGVIAAVSTAIVSLLAWQVWGVFLRRRTRPSKRSSSMKETRASVHDRIDYVLTEARVMLPGAQALLGFQLIVPLMKAFEGLPDSARAIHFAALILVALAIVLLISPAAIHRIAFQGADDERFLRIGSRTITAALIPLALGIASELYVASTRLLPGSQAGVWTALGASGVLFGFWYVLPLALRRTLSARRQKEAAISGGF
jgi:hypothetical protein